MRRDNAVGFSPLHHSVRKLRGMGTPRNMDAVTITHEQSEAVQRIALDIFADCSNRGIAFSDALAAVYMSGLEHGVTCTNLQNSKTN